MYTDMELSITGNAPAKHRTLQKLLVCNEIF